MLSLRGIFFDGFASHVYYFRVEIYNKTIIEFSLRIRFLWHNTSKNPCRVSHAMRPGLKDAVKCILRIGSAHNKGGGGGGGLDINIA